MISSKSFSEGTEGLFVRSCRLLTTPTMRSTRSKATVRSQILSTVSHGCTVLIESPVSPLSFSFWRTDRRDTPMGLSSSVPLSTTTPAGAGYGGRPDGHAWLATTTCFPAGQHRQKGGASNLIRVSCFGPVRRAKRTRLAREIRRVPRPGRSPRRYCHYARICTTTMSSESRPAGDFRIADRPVVLLPCERPNRQKKSRFCWFRVESARV
jgi:hypothetical protein